MFLYIQVKCIKELIEMLDEWHVKANSVKRKLLMVSLLEVFKDILPAYRIRQRTEQEKQVKVSLLIKLMKDR